MFLLIFVMASEWQSGIDNLINNQQQLQLSSNYPIQSVIHVTFEKQFTDIPQIILLIEKLEFESDLDIDLSLFSNEIQKNGFDLKYRLGGPARVFNILVRWVAFIDKNVKLYVKELGFMDLKFTRQGSGQRTDTFDIQSPYKDPRIITFLSGFRLNPNSGVYSILINNTPVNQDSFQVNIETRENTVIRYAKLYILLVDSSSKVVAKQGGSDAKGFNYFEDKSSSGIRRVEYRIPINERFFYKPDQNIVAQGLRGFEANSTASDIIAFSMDKYQLADDHYQMIFGPNLNSVLYGLDFSILLVENNNQILAQRITKNQ